MQRLIPLFFVLFLTAATHPGLSQTSDQTPPANNSASGAVELKIQDTSCKDNNTATTGTFANATHSGEKFENSDGGCGSQENAKKATTPSDVWYKVTVPSSGTFKISAQGKDSSLSGVSETSLTAVFFTESGGTYTRFDCNQYGGNEPHEIKDQTEGETVYIQLLSNSELFGYSSSSDFSSFTLEICAFQSGTLNSLKIKNPLLSYYSNPVGNHLVVESPYEIQSLSVYDLRGKAVLHKTPYQQKLRLQTYMLAAGAYVLRVETPAGQQTVQLLKK